MDARISAVFPFPTRNPLLGQIWSKKKIIKIVDKFGTETNLNMQYSMAMFNSSVFDWNYPFLGQFCPNNQNCLFKVDFGT